MIDENVDGPNNTNDADTAGKPLDDKANAAENHRAYLEGMTPEHRMLLTLRDELYHGDWGMMLEDLKTRLKGRPYIFKLVNRIEEDIERIDTLQRYETKHSINLADALKELENESVQKPSNGSAAK